LLKTDAEMQIRLRLPKRKEPININGRVAWIRDIQESPPKGVNKYKIGLEFISLKINIKKLFPD